MSQISTDVLHYSLLEDGVKSRLLEIDSKQCKTRYQHRVMKSGIFRHSPVKIISQLNLKKRSSYYHSPDSLSHQLSLLDFSSHAQSIETISTIILIPEYISNQKHLLTHTYNAHNKILGMYLYPHRFNENPQSNCAKLIQKKNNRLQDFIKQPSTSILSQVIRMIPTLNHSNSLHSFLIPTFNLNDQEKLEMEICQDLYSLSSR